MVVLALHARRIQAVHAVGVLQTIAALATPDFMDRTHARGVPSIQVP
jgi:hypothetical protein